MFKKPVESTLKIFQVLRKHKVSVFSSVAETPKDTPKETALVKQKMIENMIPSLPKHLTSALLAKYPKEVSCAELESTLAEAEANRTFFSVH